MTDEHHEDNDSNIEMDFSKYKKYFTPKVRNVLLIMLLILIPVILTGYIRLSAENIPATDSWAQSSVENYYKNQISQQVAAQYPNLPVSQRNKLVDDQWKTFEQNNKAQLQEQIKQTSQYFKSGLQYTENGTTYTYLGDLDSYFYLRQARNLQQNGYICDYVASDGRCVDALMVAPETRPAEPSMHPYAEFYLYKVLHFFNKEVNLMQAAFILPTILAMIAAVAAFFVGRRLMNNTAGFFAAMFIATSPALISRTMGSDTDIWNIVFPIVIMWVFLEAFYAKRLWSKITLTAVTGLLFAIFNFAWSGWWYMFYFIIIAMIGHIIYLMIRRYIHHKTFKGVFDAEAREDSMLLGILFASTAIFVSLFYSFGSFIAALKSPFYYMATLKVAAATDLWPNVLTTVAELNNANISTILTQASSGMLILFALSLIGIIFTLVKKEPDTKDYLLIAVSAIMYVLLVTKFNNMPTIAFLILLLLPVLLAIWFNLTDPHKRDIKPALIFMIWLVGMIYTSTKGVRFIFLLTPVFCIALGIAIGYIYQYLVRLFKEQINFKEYWLKLAVFLVLCLVLIVPISAGVATGKAYVPSMTTGWWDSLSKIRQESSPDAIITSWWDFGHWFKYVANRRVTFDGASQLPPLALWVGKSLQTSNEQENIGILRMLACGSNKAFEEVDKKFHDTEISQNIVSELILLDKTKAAEYLKSKGFNDSEINEILKYSHCNPPEVYYITSEDMVGKSGVWAHFGTWNLDRAYIINNLKDKSVDEAVSIMKQRWNYTDEQATSIYYEVQALTTDSEMNNWISGWPSYVSNTIPCSESKGLVLCNLNLGIGNDGKQQIVIESAIINLTSPENSQMKLAGYDATSGAKLGESITAMDYLAISNDGLKTYNPKNATIDLGLLLDINTEGNTTKYTAIVSNTALTTSMFTRLFFLDGKQTTHFTKFSDVTDITGTRIIIWKVNFD